MALFRTCRRSLPVHILGHLIVRMSRKHMPVCIMQWVGTVHRRGYDDKQKGTISDAYGLCPSIWNILKPTFSPNLTDSRRLRVAQVPRSRDMVIFVLMTTTGPIILPPCTDTWGNYSCASITEGQWKRFHLWIHVQETVSLAIGH